jgi:predicted DNA-binding transcriptional regulator YafY
MSHRCLTLEEQASRLFDPPRKGMARRLSFPARRFLNPLERFYRIDQLLNEQGCVSLDHLCTALEVSRATLKRDLAYMRDRMHAPIVYDRFSGGYRFDRSKDHGGPRYALPGLWFSADEIHALMTMNALLQELDPAGFIGGEVRPLIQRLEGLLSRANAPARDVLLRVRLVGNMGRPVALEWFQTVGAAVMGGYRLHLVYAGRHRNSRSARDVSPLRLVFHRNSWYLDAWCHAVDDFRTFAIDAIEQATPLQAKVKRVSLKEVDLRLGGGYGIYKGEQLQWATLHFDAQAAVWVRAERWHPKQDSRTLEDGTYELRVPYSQPHELVMDILRHGEQVEVVEPAELRGEVKRRLGLARARYAR